MFSPIVLQELEVGAVWVLGVPFIQQALKNRKSIKNLKIKEFTLYWLLI